MNSKLLIYFFDQLKINNRIPVENLQNEGFSYGEILDFINYLYKKGLAKIEKNTLVVSATEEEITEIKRTEISFVKNHSQSEIQRFSVRLNVVNFSILKAVVQNPAIAREKLVEKTNNPSFDFHVSTLFNYELIVEYDNLIYPAITEENFSALSKLLAQRGIILREEIDLSKEIFAVEMVVNGNNIKFNAQANLSPAEQVYNYYVGLPEGIIKFALRKANVQYLAHKSVIDERNTFLTLKEEKGEKALDPFTPFDKQIAKDIADAVIEKRELHFNFDFVIRTC